ncbi:MAG: MaoC family dehydratase [Acinetobacter sp.]|nr:MaoC family dehydratase [Acinetobacter sp.]
MKLAHIDDFHVGLSHTLTRTIDAEKVAQFMELCGDNNPIHHDETYAAQTQFKRPIAHGFLTASFFSPIFGLHLPGPGAIYVNHNLRFLKPVFVGDTVDIIAKVSNVDHGCKRVYFDTICNINGERVIEGEAELYVPTPTEAGQAALDAATTNV